MAISQDKSEKAIYAIALKNEIDAIAAFLRRGFLEFEARESQLTHHLPLLLLSQGIERLLKFSIYMLGKNLCSPHKGWEHQGHNLIYLSERLEIALESLGSKNALAVKHELTSLRQNRYFKILSEYGKPGRYANLDRLAREGENINQNTFEEKNGPSPHAQFTLNTVTPDEAWRVQFVKDTHKLIDGGRKAKRIPWYPVFLPPFLRTLRAITLLLHSGELGQWAKANLGSLAILAELVDEQMNDLEFLKI